MLPERPTQGRWVLRKQSKTERIREHRFRNEHSKAWMRDSNLGFRRNKWSLRQLAEHKGVDRQTILDSV